MKARWRACLLLVVLCCGCEQQMARQPSLRPLRPSSFFADGASAQLPVEGTVARGQLRIDPHRFAGLREPQPRDFLEATTFLAMDGWTRLAVAPAVNWSRYADEMPMPLDLPTLERGRQRFDVFCAVCHDRVGTGRGMIVQRGFTRPPSLHDDWSRGLELRGIRTKLRDVPVGYLFQVITQGMGAMPSYASQIPVDDRWAIVGYVRALQLSQHAPLDKVHDPALREKLTRGVAQ